MCTPNGLKKTNKLIRYSPAFIQAIVFSIIFPGILPLPLLLIEFFWCIFRTSIPKMASPWITFGLTAYRLVRLSQLDECILEECTVSTITEYVLLFASLLMWVDPQIPIEKEKVDPLEKEDTNNMYQYPFIFVSKLIGTQHKKAEPVKKVQLRFV